MQQIGGNFKQYCIDCNKTFDCLDHENLCIAQKEMASLQLLTVLRNHLYSGQQVIVSTKYEEIIVFHWHKIRIKLFNLSTC